MPVSETPLDDTSLHEKARQVLDRQPKLIEEMFYALRELFKDNPPVVVEEGGGRGGGVATIAARKREWVAQRVAELSEIVGCLVIAAYYRYRVRKEAIQL